jgi:ABC-type transport system involved in multi-copper enzyme maturation permease subunit
MRLLWPSWAAALLMAFSMWLVPRDQSNASDLVRMLVVIPFLVCPAMLVTMTLSSFGREITSNTFSNLLAQPIPRARIWWTKTLLLAAAVGIVWTVWWFSFLQSRDFRRVPHEEIRNALVITVLFVLGAYSGGLWTVLLFRQVAAAFWFTLLLPATIVMTTQYLFQDHADWVNKALIVAFGVYSLAGFLFARWLFLRAQDVHWTGGAIALPGWRRKTSAVTEHRAKRRRPWCSLFAKEIHLHQSQLIIAGIMALLHVGVILTRKFGGDFKRHLVLEIVVDGFWLLWFVMPLLFGCDAVAEERKLGTLEAQLCLPARRRTQFMIKFVTTLLLSILLGMVVPIIFEGRRIIPPGPDFSDGAVPTPTGIWILFGDFVVAFGWMLPFLAVAGIAVLIATISFYASTLARSTVQALAPAALGIILMWVSLLAGDSFILPFQLWHGWLGHLIGVPVMTLVLFGLMYWNFKRVLVGWAVWRRNILVLVLSFAFVTVATATIYNRAWELFAAEPSHGPARLNTGAVKLKSVGASLTAELPDGRVWTALLWQPAPQRGGFLGGTNWAQIETAGQNFIGIQKDGSLWTVPNIQLLVTNTLANQNWMRVGTDNDWKTVASGGSQAFLLKNDGTLWRWGDYYGRSSDLSKLLPELVNTDTDWNEVSTSPSRRAILRKIDDSVWVSPSLGTIAAGTLLPGTINIQRVTYLDAYRTTVELFEHCGPFVAGIRDDGTFRIVAAHSMMSENGRVFHSSDFMSADIALDARTNWVGVASTMWQAVTLNGEGTLWKWSFPLERNASITAAKSECLGKRSDWIAVTSGMGGVVSLAADGGLWQWEFEPERSLGTRHARLLRTSRRPQLIGNLFAPAGQ